MSACPIPSKKKKSNNSVIASKTATPKAPIQGCKPASFNPKVDMGACCSAGIPGPAGPQGPQGPAGIQGPCGEGLKFQNDWSSGNDYWIASAPSICATDLVRHNGRIYICLLDNIADSSSEPGVGSQWTTYWALYSGEASFVVWRGYWQTGVGYAENDYVTHEGSSYMCTVAHTSSTTDEPDMEFDYEGGANWILVSSGDQPEITKEYKGFIESLKDGVMDWVNNIPNWGVTDWLKNIAAGAMLIWAGSSLLNMMSLSGSGDGEGGVTYTGSNGYTGTYTQPTIAEVLEDLLLRAGLTSIDFDLSEVQNDTLEGIFASNPNVSEAIDNIVFVYQLNVVNLGGVLRFTPRKTDITATMGDGEFGYGEVGEFTSAFTAKRLQSIDLPKKVMIEYISRDLDYGSFSQETPFLESFPEGKSVGVSVPFVLTPQQAKDAADFMLIQPHLERNVWSGTTTYKWATLEPGDVINTSKGLGRIIEIQENEEGLLDIVFADAGLPNTPQPVYSGPVIIGYTASDYVGSGIAPTPEPINTNTVKDSGYSGVIVCDLPPLYKGDNTPRVYLAVHGYGNPNWSGGNVYKSTDGGSTYNVVGSSFRESTIGMVDSPLGDPTDYHVWDEVNTVDVELKTGQLQSKDELSVLNGANTAMIGSEMIAFKTATLIGTSVRGNNIYRLSGLMRGLQGTEWVFDGVAHQAQELFILIDETLVRHEIAASEIRTVTKYKAVTFGGTPANVDPTDYTIVSINMVPWKVACPHSTKDCTTRDFNVEWTPRSRACGDGLDDYTELEHDVDFGGWTIAVMDGLTEKRKWHVTTPYTKYTKAQQIEDWGSERISVTYNIAAMNRVYGTGYPTTFVSGGTCS